jgi:cyanophycinase
MVPALPSLLALIGGNEDRLTPGTVLRDLVAACRAERHAARPADAALQLVVLSTASGEPEFLWSQYEPAFRALGAEPRWLDIRERAAAAHPDTLAALRDADLLFMTGGDQERLVDIVAGTPLHALILDRHARGELAIAGTSAGASALGAHMPVGDLNEQIVALGQPESLHAALGLLPALVIDQHFAQRRRHARLMHLVMLSPRHLGVGVDEDTALLIRPGRGLRVVGSGAVTLIDGSRASERREGGAPTSASASASTATSTSASPTTSPEPRAVAIEPLGFFLLPSGCAFELSSPSLPAHLHRVLHAIAG